MKKTITWVLVLYTAFVFLQSLFFKFGDSVQPVIIFTTIGDWMSDIGLPAFISENFKAYGGWGVGLTELIASILLFIPATRKWGAIVGIIVMSGAIFFHLGTPLGVDRAIDYAGNTDGGTLFYMACGVWVACALLLWMDKQDQQITTTER